MAAAAHVPAPATMPSAAAPAATMPDGEGGTGKRTR